MTSGRSFDTSIPQNESIAIFAALTARRMGALLVANDPLFTTRRDRIVALAARNAAPTIYSTREFAEGGGLIAYGANLPDVYRLAGGYAGRILKSEKPADLPVLVPTTFEMIINMKTAKALGLNLPPTLLAIADEVIRVGEPSSATGRNAPCHFLCRHSRSTSISGPAGSCSEAPGSLHER